MNRSILRVICVSVDAGAAANVGGPVHIDHKTFDVPATPELVKWLEVNPRSYISRSIQGVELITQEDA